MKYQEVYRMVKEANFKRAGYIKKLASLLKSSGTILTYDAGEEFQSRDPKTGLAPVGTFYGEGNNTYDPKNPMAKALGPGSKRPWALSPSFTQGSPAYKKYTNGISPQAKAQYDAYIKDFNTRHKAATEKFNKDFPNAGYSFR